MADENISVLSDKFNSLRALKGHYNGGEFNKDLDGPQGEKYQVMKVRFTKHILAGLDSHVSFTTRV